MPEYILLSKADNIPYCLALSIKKDKKDFCTHIALLRSDEATMGFEFASWQSVVLKGIMLNIVFSYTGFPSDHSPITPSVIEYVWYWYPATPWEPNGPIRPWIHWIPYGPWTPWGPAGPCISSLPDKSLIKSNVEVSLTYDLALSGLQVHLLLQSL